MIFRTQLWQWCAIILLPFEEILKFVTFLTEPDHTTYSNLDSAIR